MIINQYFGISKNIFLTNLMEEWRQYAQSEKVSILSTFTKYDSNGDGVLTLNEFEILIHDLDPKMDQSHIAHLFMKVRLFLDIKNRRFL